MSALTHDQQQRYFDAMIRQRQIMQDHYLSRRPLAQHKADFVEGRIDLEELERRVELTLRVESVD